MNSLNIQNQLNSLKPQQEQDHKIQIDLSESENQLKIHLENKNEKLENQILLLEAKLNLLTKIVQDSKNEQETTDFSIFKKIFITWSKRTNVNCYGKIFFYENYFVRLIWTSIFLASLGVTGWIMSWNIVAFLQYGVVSSTKVVYENPTQFPAVTICDYNPFTCKKGNDLVSDIFDRTECQDSVIGPLNCALNLASMIASDPSYGDENRKKAGLTFRSNRMYL